MSGLETLIASLAGNEDLGRGESATRMWAVRPILEALGWRFVPDEVVPKDRDDGGSAYYCLRGGGRNLALVDVRRAGADLSGEQERTLASAAGEEAPLAVLTDGLAWLFYLPERTDGGDPQPFRRADCREEDAARAAAGLERFLGREALRGGAALEAARAEYDRRERARAALDAAWEHMLSDPGGLVRDLLAETAREQSGADPDPEAVSGFLREKLEGGARRPRRGARRGTRSAPRKAVPPPMEERDAAIVLEYKSGMTMLEVGERHGISRERVRQILKRKRYAERSARGYAVERAKRKDYRRARAVAMAADGLDAAAIATRLGVAVDTVNYYLRDAGQGRGRGWRRGQQADLTEEQIKEVLAVYEEADARETARRCGLSPHVVFRLLREHGVLRKRGARPKERE